jgi:hypothetical protein
MIDHSSSAVNGDFRTCSELIEWGRQYEIGSDRCGRYENDSYNCCPTVPENPCIICPNGATVSDYFVPHQMKGGHARNKLSVPNVSKLGPTHADCMMYMMAKLLLPSYS